MFVFFLDFVRYTACSVWKCRWLMFLKWPWSFCWCWWWKLVSMLGDDTDDVVLMMTLALSSLPLMLQCWWMMLMVWLEELYFWCWERGFVHDVDGAPVLVEIWSYPTCPLRHCRDLCLTLGTLLPFSCWTLWPMAWSERASMGRRIGMSWSVQSGCFFCYGYLLSLPTLLPFPSLSLYPLLTISIPRQYAFWKWWGMLAGAPPLCFAIHTLSIE